ncbi:YagK/YfjJ domain-containing protein [Aeromonas veronii]|uniref:hypothetical protein n=1 Tax=Aeromonas veronii TaxID=654 RepID=UPI0018F25164|nr:hypothetical protein [Aeromonas veronii]MBJ7590833.1 hypothetical protein [Aeromonas veronii]
MSISIEEYVLLAQQFYEGRNYSFNVDNLEKILSVSESALKHYPRVFSFRVDLRFQQDPAFGMYLALKPEAGSRIIKEFFSREGANKRGNSSRLTQSFHFFMFEPIFSPVNASNQPI